MIPAELFPRTHCMQLTVAHTLEQHCNTPHSIPKMFCGASISESPTLDQTQAYLKLQQDFFFHFHFPRISVPSQSCQQHKQLWHGPAEQLLWFILLISYKKSHFNLFPGNLCSPVSAGEMNSSSVKVQLFRQCLCACDCLD